MVFAVAASPSGVDTDVDGVGDAHAFPHDYKHTSVNSEHGTRHSRLIVVQLLP
jgi:hypothetical protein